MLVLGVLTVIIGVSGAGFTPDSTPFPRAADPAPAITEWAPISDSLLSPTLRQSPRVPADSPHVRRKAVETSDWYSRRLTIHRYVAYATIPVFAVQYAAGDQLFTKGRDAPTWAKTTHRVGATALAGMFTVNTVTGVWNWWDSRSAKQGRTLRTLHAISMLGADAAFTYAGAKLSNEAEVNLDKRRLHRTIALSAMGVTALSGVAMKLWNR
jgi:hypothetical protein